MNSIAMQALNEISALADRAFGTPNDYTARCGDIAKNALNKASEIPTKQCRSCKGTGDKMADGRGCQSCRDTGRVPA